MFFSFFWHKHRLTRRLSDQFPYTECGDSENIDKYTDNSTMRKTTKLKYQAMRRGEKHARFLSSLYWSYYSKNNEKIDISADTIQFPILPL